MIIKIGTEEVGTLAIGANDEVKIYKGTEVIYEGFTPLPNTNPQSYDDFILSGNKGIKKINTTHDEFYL